jgi:hypothetical protein
MIYEYSPTEEYIDAYGYDHGRRSHRQKHHAYAVLTYTTLNNGNIKR